MGLESDEKKQHANRSSATIIQFLGGKSTLFVLISILLLGLIVMVFNRISFIFYPFTVFFSTVVLPIVLATIGYYLLRPILGIT